VSSSTLAGSNQEWLPLSELTIVPASYQNHPQISLISEDYLTNQRGYAYLRWEVMHPTTLIVWRNSEWLELQHSKNTGHPYHTGRRIEVYPTPPAEDDAEDLAADLTNLQIRNALAIINPSGPGSPHRPRSIELRAPTRANQPTDTLNRDTMSTQTVTVTQTIARTLAGGGGDGEPPLGPSHQDPQRIRDVFDIALGRAPRPPGGPGGPNDPRGPGGPPDVPPAYLIPI
jgi:hypothetical protein